AHGLARGHYILATIHRAENTDHPDRLLAIMHALGTVAAEHPVVMPLHPRTRHTLTEGAWEAPPGMHILSPLGYLDLQALEHHARLIITDSGGIQKEAFFHRVPCLTLRDETEWVELVESGWNRLVPPSSSGTIVAAVREALEAGLPPEPDVPLYGDGTAAPRIAELLGNFPGVKR
ncbi:MAG: UDP-N-acetylglucosamine 2-epimerase, partial [Gemmatimonadales bacterium]